jgi:allantoin racemase
MRRRVTGAHAMQFEPGETDPQSLREVVRLFADQAKPLVAAGCDVLIPGGEFRCCYSRRCAIIVVDGAPVINGIPIAV